MNIPVILERPTVLDKISSFRTEKLSHTRTTWECKGPIDQCQKGAQLAGTIRAILESLQELHCTVEDVHYGANHHMIVRNGVIRVWSEESKKLAERAVEDIEKVFEQMQYLSLRSFDFYIEYSLDQQIKSTDPEPWRQPIYGAPNNAGQGW